MMIDKGEEKGTIEKEEKMLINNVFEINDMIVSEVMTPRIDIFAIDINKRLKEQLDEIDELKKDPENDLNFI